MKLIIQIPCYNEEESLPLTLSQLPRKLDGIDVIEYLIIDDGSSDKTVEVAKQHRVDHVVSLSGHQGLARGFMAGLEACIQAGADIILNTDADNQYSAGDIPKILSPILNKEADIVIGSRSMQDISHFSRSKKILQKFGTWVIRQVSHTSVTDATSGFRAMTREAAMKLNVFSNYTYTLETIIQAGQKGMVIKSVPIHTNVYLRPSRLFNSVFGYIKKSIVTIVRIFVIYKPFRFFVSFGLVIFFGGLLIGGRFLWFYFHGSGHGHVQSLIFASILFSASFLLFIVGFLADLIAVNRKLLEKIDWRLYKIEEYIDKDKK